MKLFIVYTVMKKILLAALLFISFTAMAQDMKTVFVNMPDSLSPLLTKVNREDFADFLASNMKAQVKNKFDGTSEMKTLTKDYLLLQSTGNSSVQMKLLPLSDSLNVVCVVNTVEGPVADSSVRFYTSDWKELPISDYITLPTRELFLAPSDTISLDEQQLALSFANMDLIQADLSAENNELTFNYTTIQYLDSISADMLRPYLRKSPLIYKWNGNGFSQSN